MRRSVYASGMMWWVGWLASSMAQPMREPPRLTGGSPHRASACRPVVFEGVVHTGESFRRELGGGLSLVLEAVGNGWIVRVLPSSRPRPDRDFAELATPPFRSVNPLLLTTDFGFRAQDVIGWNPRRFRYLGGRSAYPAALSAYRMVLSTARPTVAQQTAVARVAETALEGSLEILDASLVPGTADQSAAAALLASHFASTAHTIAAVDARAPDRLGRIVGLRFRGTFDPPGVPACRADVR